MLDFVGSQLYNLRVPHFSEINATTRYCAVLGHPIKHSASPGMHNPAMAALGLNWRYLAFDVDPCDLPQALQGAKRMKFVGLNLTVPHKLLAVELVDELDVSAQEWGAVNTVQFLARVGGVAKPVWQLDPDQEAEIFTRGYNTDADAITRSIEEDLGHDINGSTILLLGAGGAGRVAALKFAAEGVANLFLVNRTMEKAEAVAEEIRERFPEVNVRCGYPNSTVELVVNATSAGLKATDPLPFDESRWSLSRAAKAYDMIYRPAETPFLQAARLAGCKTANGVGMLLYQGAKALEIWSGEKPPIALMRDALLKNVYGTAAGK